MGQKLRDDKIGALSHSGGNITMQNSFLTLGGQQYESGVVIKALGSPAASTLYYLYAYYSGGVQLDLSTTVPSSYLSASPARKLVGALYTNGSSAFGSFVNIDGVPTTDWISFTPTGSFNTNTTYTGFWKRSGDTIDFSVKILFTGVPNAAASLTVNIPFSTINLNKITEVTGVQNPFGMLHFLDSGTNNYAGAGVFPNGSDGTSVRGRALNVAGSLVASGGIDGSGNPISWATNDTILMKYSVPLTAFSNAALKDL